MRKESPFILCINFIKSFIFQLQSIDQNKVCMIIFVQSCLTLHYMGSNFTYFTWGGADSAPPSKMDLSDCFWLKSTSNPKSR